MIPWALGPPARLPEPLAPVILDGVKTGPHGCGLNRAHGTSAELAHHLYPPYAIQVGETVMRTFCHRHGIRPYRLPYQSRRGDPVRQAAAREALAALKQTPKRASASF